MVLISVKCKGCGNLFTAKKREKNRPAPKYCSRLCYGRAIAKWKVCKGCAERFYNYQNKFFCSKKCEALYKTGKPFSLAHRKALSAAKKGKPINHFEANRELNNKKISEALTGVPQFNRRGSLHPQWKGGQVSYVGLHKWVERELGRPRKCELCRSTKAKKYEWANKNHKYKRNLQDWIRTCTRCHRNYDKKHNNR